MAEDVPLLTLVEVIRNPVVTYQVCGYFPEEECWSYDTEAEAVDAARMMESGHAVEIIVQRRTLRVAEDVEDLEWR